ncbi:MAG: hypothetical protein KJ630_07220 [Proteobacteria bacterium]|nr:hypothetical protein [Pseudomonadota bacterium]
MLRLKKSSLDCKAGKLYCGDDLFSGLAFENQGDLIVGVQLVKQGSVVGSYNDLMPLPNGSGKRINQESLYDKEGYGSGPFCYEEVPFTGVAYYFEGSFCVEESAYSNGEILDTREWYPSGQPQKIELTTNLAFYIMEWYADRQVKAVSIRTSSVLVKASFDEHGSLDMLFCPDPYLEMLKDLTNDDQLNCLEHLTMEGLRSKAISSKLVLNGTAIDQRLCHILLSMSAPAEIEKLSLMRTSLTEQDVSAIIKQLSPKELQLIDNVQLSDGIYKMSLNEEQSFPKAIPIKRFKELSPRITCQMSLNEERSFAEAALVNRFKAEKQYKIKTWGYSSIPFWLITSTSLLTIATAPLAASKTRIFACIMVVAGLFMLSCARFVSPKRAQLILTSSYLFIPGFWAVYPISLNRIHCAFCVELMFGPVWLGISFKQGQNDKIRLPFLFRVIEAIGKLTSWLSFNPRRKYDLLIPTDDSLLDAKTSEIAKTINKARCKNLQQL